MSQALTTQRTERTCRLVEWKPWSQPNHSLLGHCAIAFAGGWVVVGIPIFRRGDGSLSAGVPSSAQLDAEGRIKVRDGKRQYSPILTFESADAKARWQRMVLGALAGAGIGEDAP